MEIEQLRTPAAALDSHADRIRLFAWWLHAHRGKTHFEPTEVTQVYRALSIAEPNKFGPYYAGLVDRGDLLKERAGYKLESKARAAMEKKYGQNKQTVEIKALLKGLPAKLPTLAEKTYLEEAFTCYEHEAFRAAVVMTWNLAYAHLCDHVLKNKLAEFNARWAISLPGMHSKGAKTIKAMDDFNDLLKESEVLKVCKDGAIIGKNVYDVLDAGLKRRNQCAHPNNVVIKQLQADAFIDDLITNAVLQIK